MSIPPRACPAFLALALAACASTGGGGGSAQPAAVPAGPPEKSAVFAPSQFRALSIWTEQYAGGLLVLDAKQPGTLVAEGDVIATLDTHAIEDELHKAELEAQSAGVRHQGVVERNKLDEAAARSQLELAKAALERSQRSLAGWKESELAFAKRSDEIQKRQEQSRLDDETDELDQLEKMYKADALVDATEEIVLKRSRRSLELTRTANQLSRDRSAYRESLELALQTEQKEEQVRVQAEALARLTSQLALDARARADAELRSADGLREQTERLEKLRRDRAQLVLRAPRAGLLLHGAAKDYRPGRTPPRYERGSQLPFRQDLFLVADPEPSSVTLDLGDADLAFGYTQLPSFGDGAMVRVQTLGAAPAQVSGRLHVDPYARANALCEASVTLDKPLAGALYGARAKVQP